MSVLAIIYLVCFAFALIVGLGEGRDSDGARGWRGITLLLGVALSIVVLA